MKLVELGATIDKVATGLGATAAVAAAGTGQLTVIEILAELGADFDIAVSKKNVHKQLPFGATPIYVAAMRGYAEIVAVLIGQDVDIDHPAVTGETPLFAAALEGQSA